MQGYDVTLPLQPITTTHSHVILTYLDEGLQKPHSVCGMGFTVPLDHALIWCLACLQREWIETQVQVQTDALATWPEHIFEHFVVVVSTHWMYTGLGTGCCIAALRVAWVNAA